MAFIMTMFSPKKRGLESSPTRSSANNSIMSPGAAGGGGSGSRSSKRVKFNQEPHFTFDEVRSMIDAILEKETKTTSAPVKSGFRQLDFEGIAAPGHTDRSCRELIEKLVNHTRRTRTLGEVLTDIKNNLNKKSYTAVIQRATMDVLPPKRPASAYLLYHKKRFEELKTEIPQASVIAKKVSEEWKNLDERKRLPFQRQHNELLRKYEREMKKLGFKDKSGKPKRIRSVKALYIQEKLQELPDDIALDKSKLAEKKEQLAKEFDEADKNLKNEYNKKFELEQERYEQEHSEYVAANPHLDHHVETNARERKFRSAQPKPPQPPKSALKFFLAKKIPIGLEGQELEETKQKLKIQFATLRDKKVLKYVKKAVRDKERYDEELEQYKIDNPGVPVKPKSNVTKEQWKLYLSAVEARPVIPEPTAYLYFCGEDLRKLHDGSQQPKERMQSISATWSNLSAKERLAVEREHIERIKSYISEMEAWLESQDAKKRDQVLNEDPRCRPDYWRKRLIKLERSLARRS